MAESRHTLQITIDRLQTEYAAGNRRWVSVHNERGVAVRGAISSDTNLAGTTSLSNICKRLLAPLEELPDHSGASSEDPSASRTVAHTQARAEAFERENVRRQHIQRLEAELSAANLARANAEQMQEEQAAFVDLLIAPTSLRTCSRRAHADV